MEGKFIHGRKKGVEGEGGDECQAEEGIYYRAERLRIILFLDTPSTPLFVLSPFPLIFVLFCLPSQIDSLIKKRTPQINYYYYYYNTKGL